MTLLRLTDASLILLDHRIAALWRGARERAEDARESRLCRFRELLGDFARLVGDEVLGAAELRSRLQVLIARFEPERDATQVSAIRQELGRKSSELARRLKTARAAALAVPADHRPAEAFAALDALAAAAASTLPDGHAQPFGPSWQGLIDQPDRAAALGCFRAATLMALKRALRNRSVSVAHSLSYRAPEDRLIPLKLWQRERKRFIRDLNLPEHAETYLRPLEAGLTAGLVALAEAVSHRAISRGWDGLLRLGASVKHGWYPATETLDRFGSAAAGDPVFEAGDELGKLLRTLYLCDFLSNPVFRADILDLLNQGEAVHSLQRAIHNGGITAKHGRTTERLGAISRALTLLANIIMAWNTHRMQGVIDQAQTNHPDEVLSRLAPIGHKHINMRGTLKFELAPYASSLLRPGHVIHKEHLLQTIEIESFSDRPFWLRLRQGPFGHFFRLPLVPHHVGFVDLHHALHRQRWRCGCVSSHPSRMTEELAHPGQHTPSGQRCCRTSAKHLASSIRPERLTSRMQA